MERKAETQPDRAAIAAAQIDLADKRDIAVGRGGELVVQLEVVGEVLPSVGRPDITARTMDERGRRRHREPYPVLVGREKLPSRDSRYVAIVAPSPDLQMGRYERVNMEAAQQLEVVAFEARLDHHARLMRVGDELHHELVAPLSVGVDDSDAESVLPQVLDSRLHVAMGVVKEGFAVADEQLGVANLRAVERREIDLAEDAVGHREPYAARGRICGPDYVLGAMRPSGLDTGRPRGRGEGFNRCHFFTFPRGSAVAAPGDVLPSPAKSRQIPPNPAKSRQIPLSRLRPLSGVTNRISGDAKRVRDADTQSVKCQQWNRQQEWRHHVGRRQRNRHDENSENRVAQMMDHHAVIDESKPRQEKCENGHLECDPESQQQFRGKSQILTYPDCGCNTDAGVLVQEK